MEGHRRVDRLRRFFRGLQLRPLRGGGEAKSGPAPVVVALERKRRRRLKVDYELAQSLAAEITEVAAELRSFIGEVREELLAEILELKRRVAELELAGKVEGRSS